MKCPSCDAEFTGKFCKCGYGPSANVIEATRTERRTIVMRREVAERTREVERFVEQYRKEHPHCTYPEACLAYAKQHRPKAMELFEAIVPKRKWNDDYFEHR